MQSKKLFLLLGLLALMATTGGLVWFWWADSPPKVPVRARSVQVENLRPIVVMLPSTASIKIS